MKCFTPNAIATKNGVNICQINYLGCLMDDIQIELNLVPNNFSPLPFYDAVGIVYLSVIFCAKHMNTKKL